MISCSAEHDIIMISCSTGDQAGAMRVGLLGVAADEDDDYDDGLDAAYGADSPPPQAHQDAKGKMEARGHAGFVIPVSSRLEDICNARSHFPLGQTRRSIRSSYFCVCLFACTRVFRCPTRINNGGKLKRRAE